MQFNRVKCGQINSWSHVHMWVCRTGHGEPNTKNAQKEFVHCSDHADVYRRVSERVQRCWSVRTADRTLESATLSFGQVSHSEPWSWEWIPRPLFRPLLKCFVLLMWRHFQLIHCDQTPQVAVSLSMLYYMCTCNAVFVCTRSSW